MRILFTLIICLSFSVVFSQNPSEIKMPAHTIGSIQTLKKQLAKNNGFPNQLMQRKFAIHKINGRYLIDVLCKVNSNFSATAAIENGFYIGAISGNVVSLKIPLELFNEQFYFPGIEYLESSTIMEPYLDGAILDIHADSVHNGINLPQSYTGKNVLVGVVDWGFEYIHPTFYDTTMTQNRVVAAWDQVKTTGPSPTGFNYGTVYSNTTEIETAERDTFSFVSDYHGTHVAGIAGGAGAGTIYRGVGFESDLLFAQMNGHASYSLDAYQWMYNVSQSLGKRLVINNSFGSVRDNPLDGTSLFSQAVEAYIDSGVVFCVSAGNSGGSNFHLEKTFNNDSIRTRVGGFNYTSDPDLWGETIQMWGEPGNNFSTKIRIINGSNQVILETPFYNTGTAQPYLDTFMNFGIDTVWYRVTVDATHPLNGRPQMKIDVRMPTNGDKCIMISEATSGTVHYWNSRLTIFGGGNTAYPFVSYGSGYSVGNSEYAVGHPSVTSGVISVAAHTTNANITSFSSHGPRMDEFEKPDISAPGLNIVSALNSAAVGSFTPITTVNFNSNDYDFVRLSGTSMSCPMVTGTVALMLEANPNLTPAEVKDLIKYTAYEDSYTGTIFGHSDIWGRGKLDAYQAVKTVFTVDVDELSIKEIKYYPNPVIDIIYLDNSNTVNLNYEVFSMDGKKIFTGKMENNSIDFSNFDSGIYLIHLFEKDVMKSFKVIKI